VKKPKPLFASLAGSSSHFELAVELPPEELSPFWTNCKDADLLPEVTVKVTVRLAVSGFWEYDNTTVETVPEPAFVLNETHWSEASAEYVVDKVQDPEASTVRNWLPDADEAGFVLRVRTGAFSTLSSEPQAVASKDNATLDKMIISDLLKDINLSF